MKLAVALVALFVSTVSSMVLPHASLAVKISPREARPQPAPNPVPKPWRKDHCGRPGQACVGG
ncbi:hypothetical protein K3495_g5352 [Podosphaera aphanis]|nr:hypothetical protein K3495_g5352 [Podosphaera aphanis]